MATVVSDLRESFDKVASNQWRRESTSGLACTCRTTRRSGVQDFTRPLPTPARWRAEDRRFMRSTGRR